MYFAILIFLYFCEIEFAKILIGMKLIDRPSYMESLIHAQGTPDIKVVTGVRRCGKSKLLEKYIEHIGDSDNNANIIYINFSLLQYEPLLEYHVLHQYVEDRCVEGKNNYVMVDEVQMCENFERAINSLHASGKYDIYLT